MKIENFTPYPEFTFPSYSSDGIPYQTCVVRGTFKIHSDGSMIALANQPAPQLVDTYYGTPTDSSLRTEHDRVPLKPRGEIYFVDPISRNFDGSSQSEWPVSIQVGSIQFAFRVTGPRYYCRRLFGDWELTDPEPCTEVPVRYEYAFGGTDPENTTIHHQLNPIGRGFLPMRRGEKIAAAQVYPVKKGSVPVTLGITPVHRAWQPRRGFSGTFDDQWLKSKWPLYPDDFDDTFFQQGPKELQLSKGYFSGNERVHICGLGRRSEYKFCLPESRRLSLVAMGGNGESAYSEFELDTVILNLETEEIALVWRTSYALPEWVSDAAILTRESGDE